MTNKLPYGDVFSDLLMRIHKGLGYCSSQYKKNHHLSENDVSYLADLFRPILKRDLEHGLNKHLTEGYKIIDKRKNINPRLSKLIIDSFLRAQEIKKRSHYKAEIIPSPLNILYHALIVPEEPQTSAYSFVLCRSMLFYFLQLHPKHPDLEIISPNFDALTEEDILKSIGTFNSYIDIQARWPDPRANYLSRSSRINYLNGHILATKGITYLWFKGEKQLLDFCGNIEEQTALESLKKYYSNNLKEDEKYSFRIVNSYISLPDSSEIINWIFGLPIPLRGADVLFYGGLKKSTSAGLVISIHGEPGTGKTSAALSLSAVLSPFQTKTIYISLEEEPEDLKIRLNTLIPDYLKWLSIFENNYYNDRKKAETETEINWFSTFKIKRNVDLEELTTTLKLLKSDLYNSHSIVQERNKQKDSISIPSVCPLLLVIDNVNELFVGKSDDNKHYGDLELFIEQCRSMGAIVILIAADDIPGKSKLDYLVDVAVRLSQDGLEKKFEKPVRIFQLLKTRYQISRQGSHVFHLSNSKGFRISPQVPSQMDRREKLKIQLPSKKEFIYSLNLIGNKGYSYEDYLAISANSQILIHGYGSSGKAGFGMKLLLTPTQEEINESNKSYFFPENENGKVILNKKCKNKVLILSFLYPVEYYQELHNRLKDQFRNCVLGFDAKNSIIFVKAFYPGYLTAEDFIYKVVALLEQAKLEGEPYTGILLDGLHNVFLQFKYLQEAHMVWPLLYSMLSRYNLTVVSTFTNFSLSETRIFDRVDKVQLFQTPDDFMLMQQGQKPFLHGLVKAADYYFLLEEVINDQKKIVTEYWLSVKSSIKELPKDFLKWDRQNLLFYERIPSEKVYRSTPS